MKGKTLGFPFNFYFYFLDFSILIEYNIFCISLQKLLLEDAILRTQMTSDALQYCGKVQEIVEFDDLS